MKVRILKGIAGVDRVLQIEEVVDMPEKMARAYAAEGEVEIVGEEAKAEPIRKGRKPKGA